MGLAAKVLAMPTPHVQPGVSTGYLDKLCHDYIVDELQCVPTNIVITAPKTVCTSVNHVFATAFQTTSKSSKRATSSTWTWL